MPTYEYACSFCGHAFELFQSITATPLEKCPKCRKKTQRLLGSGSAVIFKGSGFYETDYKRKKPAGDSEKKDQPKTEPGQEKKPAAKPPSQKPDPASKPPSS